MSIIPLIVGCVFFAVGFNFSLNFMRFRRLGTKIKGRVKAIEKYTSVTGTGSDRTRSTFYSPIVEYVYNNKPRTIAGIGTNEIKYKLQQNINVLIIESTDDDQIQECIDDSSHYFIGAVFLIAGLVALTTYFMMGGSWILIIIALSTTTGLGYLISVMSRNVKGVLQTSEKAHSKREDSILIETKSDYIKEISSHSLWGNIIAYTLMAASIGIMYFGYSDLPEAAKNLMLSNPSYFWTKITDGKLSSSWERPLIICGMGTFFFLASLRSAYYVRKTYGGIMKM